MYVTRVETSYDAFSLPFLYNRGQWSGSISHCRWALAQTMLRLTLLLVHRWRHMYRFQRNVSSSHAWLPGFSWLKFIETISSIKASLHEDGLWNLQLTNFGVRGFQGIRDRGYRLCHGASSPSLRSPCLHRAHASKGYMGVIFNAHFCASASFLVGKTHEGVV